MSIKHSKVSTVADGSDSTQIRPSDWNQDHSITPDTIANILSDHDKATHDALGIDADLLDGSHATAFAAAAHAHAVNQIIGLAGGSATVYANTLTRVVNHNLGTIPKVFLESQSIGGIMHFVSNKTTTQFTINLASPQELDVEFDWGAILI